MIDPTCGSGHFLLGSFERLLAHWQRAEPATEATELVRRALDAVHGVDVNPFAAAIARFRLLVAALRACGAKRLADAPRFPIHVAVGDSLIHGERHNDSLRGRQLALYEEDTFLRRYPLEATTGVREILNRQYHAVLGNPPYITPKDAALNAAYRERFGSCSGKYALTVPFMERFIELAIEGRDGLPAGFIGKITSNSFMKREFGKTLVEEFFPRWDLTHVIDTSGAYIPGCGTPTVILFLRDQPPAGDQVRAVLGIRGEPSTPAEPATGHVWSAIIVQVDRPGSESEFISVEDKDRAAFGSHPWSVGGGGASDLKDQLDERASRTLGEVAESVGITAVTGEDDFFILGRESNCRRHGVVHHRTLVEGDLIRDWCVANASEALWPYDEGPQPDWNGLTARERANLWTVRAAILPRKRFGTWMKLRGLSWFEWQELYDAKLRTPLSIAFACIASHNHFVLDRGGKVFKQSAPVIKLPPEATEDDHFALLAVLNSSTACFWMKQVFYPKERATGDISTEKMRPETNRYDISATGLERFPLPQAGSELRAQLIFIASRMDAVARRLTQEDPRTLLLADADDDAAELRDGLADLEEAREGWRQELVLLQEELDWACYRLFGLIEADKAADAVSPDGEIGIVETMRPFRWFRESAPSGLPEHCIARYQARAEAIASSSELRLIEDPVYKRLWLGRQGVYGSARTSFPEMVEDACNELMLDRIESLPHWKATHPTPRTVAQLAELLEGDERFLTLLRLRTNEDAPDVERAVSELVESESVPILPALTLNATGLRKRAEWEETWRLQRIEDPFLERQEALLATHFGNTPADQKRAREHVACWLTSDRLSKERGLSDEQLAALPKLRFEWRSIDAERQRAVGGPTPPVPPKYDSSDFQEQTYWRLRGKLDVPKERFIAYPFCSPEGDPTPLVGWAGWDHAQRASALVQVLQARKNEGWTGERLLPMLVGLDQLVPWLHQWHEPERARQYEQLVETESLAAGLTLDRLRAWQPPAAARRGGRRKKATRRG